MKIAPLLLLLCATIAFAQSPNPDSVGTSTVPTPVDTSRVAAPEAPPDSVLARKLATVQQAYDEVGATAGQPTAPGQRPGMGSVFLQIFVSLAVLIGTGFAGLLLVRRLRKPNQSARAGGGALDLLEARGMGPGRQVALIRIHNRVVAVAFTPQSSILLTEFEGNDAAELIAETGIGKVGIQDFSATLDKFMDRFRAQPNLPDVPENRS